MLNLLSRVPLAGLRPRRGSSIGILFLTAMFMAGCSKSSSPTGPGNTAPTLSAPTFAGPDSSASADTSSGARTADSIATVFNFTAGGYLSLFTGLSGSQSGNTWTWKHTYTIGGNVTWTATSSSSGYDWKLVEDGTTPGGTFSNWIALNGSESTDGKTGNWVIYYPNSIQAADSVAWSTDASGILTGTVELYGPTGALLETLAFTNNKVSHSGELVIYVGAESPVLKVLDVNWTASGGTWTEYYAGTVVNTGHW